METPEQNYMNQLNVILKVKDETRRFNNLANEGKKPDIKDVQEIPLDELSNSFQDYGEDFMSEKLLDEILTNLKKDLSSLKRIIPENSRILVSAFPCNINGSLIPDEYKKRGAYLTVFFIDEKTGLSNGFGSITPSAHSRLVPKEIQEKCSFTVHYDSDTPYADEKDFEKFAEQYRKAYYELRKLLRPES